MSTKAAAKDYVHYLLIIFLINLLSVACQKGGRHKFSQAKATSLHALCSQTNSPKSNNVQFTVM